MENIGGLSTSLYPLLYSIPVSCSAIHAHCTILMCLFTVLGFSGNGVFLGYYHNPVQYAHLQSVAFKINVAWGWSVLAVNTVFTVAIMGTILSVSLIDRSKIVFCAHQRTQFRSLKQDCSLEEQRSRRWYAPWAVPIHNRGHL